MTVPGTEGRLRPLIDRLGAIVWEAIPGTRRGEATFTFVSEATEAMLGYPASRWMEDRTFWFEMIHPEDRDRVNRDIVGATVEQRGVETEYRCRAADGRELWVRNIVQPAPGPDGFALTGVLIDITEQRAAEARLLRLLELKEALAETIEPSAVAEEVAARARVALHATAAAVFLRRGDGLVMAGYDGHAGEAVDRDCVVPLEHDVPAAEAARTGAAIILSAAEVVERYPGLAAWRKLAGDGQFIALPLQGDDGPLGALALRMSPDHPSAAGDQVLLQVLARACATALQRAEHSRAEQAALRRAEDANAVLDAIITTAPEGFALLDTELRYVRVNDAMAQMAGLPAEELIGRRPGDLFPDVPGEGHEIPLRHVVTRGEAVLDIEITGRLPDAGAEERTWVLSYYPIFGARGEVAWVGAFVIEITARKRAEQRASLLAELGALLDEVVSVEERMARLVDTLVPAAFAFCAISFRGPDGTLQHVALRGQGEPDVSMPLVVRGRDLGVLAFGVEGGFGPDDAAFAEEIARRAALAVDNARLYEGEQRARDRTGIQYALAASLAEALTTADVAQAILAGIVPAIGAEHGSVWQVSEDGSELESIGWLGFTDDEMAAHRRVPLTARRPVADSIRARRWVWYATPDELDVAYPQLPLRERGLLSAGAVPLLSAGRVVGGLFISSSRPHALDEEDLALASALASQAAQALERARFYEAERKVSVTLQRALLPAELPQVDGIAIDLRYLPAAGLEAGGDFYDAMELPDGSVLFAVGDVVGRGATAAAAMGQLRSALRAFALVGDEPATILQRLSVFADTVEAAVASTAVVGKLWPGTGELRYACAGHPWPLLAQPDGTATFLYDGRGVPLGCVPDPRYAEATITLAEGATFMLYTDGLSERRGEDTEEVLERLRAATAAHATDALPELLDHAVASPGESGRNDDVALVAVRRTGRGHRRRHLTFPGETDQVPVARAAVRAWLADAGVDRAAASDLLLACGEAFANAVEHSGAAEVELELALVDAEEVTIVVRDRGTWRPPAAVTDRGRGFGLMRALTDECRIEHGEDGTVVALRHRVGSAAGSPPAVSARCEVRLEHGRAVLSGDLDLAGAAEVRQQIAGARVVDLSGVGYIDSTGARMLLGLAGAIIVAPPGSVPRRALELSGLATVLDVRDRA